MWSPTGFPLWNLPALLGPPLGKPAFSLFLSFPAQPLPSSEAWGLPAPHVHQLLCQLWVLTCTSGEGVHTRRNAKDPLGTHTCPPQSGTLPGQLWLLGPPFTCGLLTRHNSGTITKAVLSPPQQGSPARTPFRRPNPSRTPSGDCWCLCWAVGPGWQSLGTVSAKPRIFPCCPSPCPFLPPPTLSQKPPKEAAASATGRAVWMSALCPQHGPSGGAGWWRGESMAGKGPHLSCLGCPCRDPAHLLRLGGLSKSNHVLGPQHLAPRFSGWYLT